MTDRTYGCGQRSKAMSEGKCISSPPDFNTRAGLTQPPDPGRLFGESVPFCFETQAWTSVGESHPGLIFRKTCSMK